MTKAKEKLTCGLVMPISDMGSSTAAHWSEVRGILTEAIESIEEYEVAVKLVSEEDHVSIIQKNIIQNLYDSDIVVCDVSRTNGNVMFELGMRLAFDKPTIIITDDKTDYLFDIGVIEHVEYPRDLRFNSIVEFQEKLKNKVKDTYENQKKNPDESFFLSNFGTFRVAKIDSKTVSAEEYTQEIMKDLQNQMRIIRRDLYLTRNHDQHEQNDILNRETISMTDLVSARARREIGILENELHATAKNYIKEHNFSSYTDLKGNEGFYRFAIRAHMATLDKIFDSGQQKYNFIVKWLDQAIKEELS